MKSPLGLFAVATALFFAGCYQVPVTGRRALGTWEGAAAVFNQPAYRDAQERSAILVIVRKRVRCVPAG